MSAREDVIEIPIEIKTTDLEELQRLVQQLTEAKNEVEEAKRKIRAGRKTKTPTGGVGAPFSSEEEPISIFREGRDDAETLPTKFKDVSSKQPVQRETSFQELANRMREMESHHAEVVSVMAQIASAAGINLPVMANMVRAIKGGKSVIKGGGKLAAGVSPVNAAQGAKLGLVARLTAAAGPIGAMVAGGVTIIQTIDWYINNVLLVAGGPWDKRFRRVIKEEIAAETSRSEKSAINQGFKTIIATSIPRLRGSVGVKSSLEAVRKGESLYNADTEFQVKGGIP